MNSLIKILVALVFISFLVSCIKDDLTIVEETFYITIKNTDDFKHDFKISGDEEGATIKIQATHFSISEIARNESTNWSVVYHYKPESGFTGIDSVEIETNTGSDGSETGKTEIVKFVFQITE